MACRGEHSDHLFWVRLSFVFFSFRELKVAVIDPSGPVAAAFRLRLFGSAIKFNPHFTSLTFPPRNEEFRSYFNVIQAECWLPSESVARISQVPLVMPVSLGLSLYCHSLSSRNWLPIKWESCD